MPPPARMAERLKAGEIDGSEFIPYSRVKELQGDANLRMELWPSTRVRYLTMYVGPTFKDGLATDYVTDAVLKSAKTGKWEKVGQV